MNKKITNILLLTIMIILLLSSKIYASPKFELSINGLDEVESGQTITFKIRGDNIPEQQSKIAGITFDVMYDKDNLEFVSCKKLDAANGTIDLNENYPEEGRVRIGIVSLIGLNNSGELYEVTLKTKQTFTKMETELRLITSEVIDSKDNEIPTEVRNKTIKFKGEIVEKEEVNQTSANLKENSNLNLEENENLENNEIVENIEEKESIEEAQIKENKETEKSNKETNPEKKENKIIIYAVLILLIIILAIVTIKISKKNKEK